MKKFFLIAALSAVFASCDEMAPVIRDFKHEDKPPFAVITHFKYKGHDYILFKTVGANGAVGGVVHDPDCKCVGKQ